jgi:hypothetical protein
MQSLTREMNRDTLRRMAKGRRKIQTMSVERELGELADLKPVLSRMLAQTAESKQDNRDTIYKLAQAQAELVRVVDAGSAYETLMRKMWKTHGVEKTTGGQVGYALETEEGTKAFHKDEAELRERPVTICIPVFTMQELMAHRMSPPFTHAEVLVLEALTHDYDAEETDSDQ